MVEVHKAEVTGCGTQHETTLRLPGVVTTIMFAECHLDHEPHKPVGTNGCIIKTTPRLQSNYVLLLQAMDRKDAEWYWFGCPAASYNTTGTHELCN